MHLLKHQKEALSWAANKQNLALFMEMRTGKSLVAIHQVKLWGGDTLMIAPISTWYDWQELLGSLGIHCITLHGTTKQKKERLEKYLGKVPWIIINPEGVTRWGKEFFQMTMGMFDNCILDESVFIKNPKAKISKLLLKYGKTFHHRLIMTGTPIAEQTEDVVNQMIFCHGHFMDKRNFYEWRCNYMKPGRFGWYLKKGVAQAIRETLKTDSFILSAKDAGLFIDQVKQTDLVELPNRLRTDYRHLERHWKLEETSTKYGVVKDNWLAAIACGIYPKEHQQNNYVFKPKELDKLVHGELNKQQVAVFSRWTHEVHATSKQLKCPCITGNTPYDARKDLLNDFRKGNFQHLVVQSKTASRGLDLSCVDNLVMLSNYWQYELRKQIEARMNHPKRKVPTLFIDMITNNTIEENVYDLLVNKHTNARFFLQRLKAKVKNYRNG